MATYVKSRSGKDVLLLNPSEKASKFVCELQQGVHITNEGVVKKDKDGKEIPLTPTARAYRSGFLTARKDGQRAFRKKHPRYKRKTI